MKRQTFLFLLVLGSNTLFAQYTGAHNDGYGTSLSSGINTTFIGSLAIFKGGNQDGYGTAASSPVNPDPISNLSIFKGGNNDGYAMVLFNPSLVLHTALLRFEGVWKNEDALLYWELESSERPENIELQRSTNATKGFHTLATWNLNYDTHQRQYQFLDKTLTRENAETFYYRLQLRDQDQRVTYSEVVVLKRNQGAYQIKIFPNPTRGDLQFLIGPDQPDASTLEVQIRTMQGSLLKKQPLDAKNNRLSLEPFADGLYLVQVYRQDVLLESFQIILKK